MRISVAIVLHTLAAHAGCLRERSTFNRNKFIWAIPAQFRFAKRKRTGKPTPTMSRSCSRVTIVSRRSAHARKRERRIPRARRQDEAEFRGQSKLF